MIFIADLVLDGVHAADAFEVDVGAFDVGIRRRRLTFNRLAKPTIDNFGVGGVVGGDAEAGGKFRVGGGGVVINRTAVDADGALGFAGPVEEPGVEDKRLGRGIWELEQLFDDHHCRGVFTLKEVDSGQSELELWLGRLGGQSQGLLVFGLSFFVPAKAGERIGKLLAQGEVVGGNLEGLAEAVDHFVARDHVSPDKQEAVETDCARPTDYGGVGVGINTRMVKGLQPAGAAAKAADNIR